MGTLRNTGQFPTKNVWGKKLEERRGRFHLSIALQREQGNAIIGGLGLLREKDRSTKTEKTGVEFNSLEKVTRSTSMMT